MCLLWLQLIATCAMSYFEGFVWNTPVSCSVAMLLLQGPNMEATLRAYRVKYDRWRSHLLKRRGGLSVRNPVGTLLREGRANRSTRRKPRTTGWKIGIPCWRCKATDTHGNGIISMNGKISDQFVLPEWGGSYRWPSLLSKKWTLALAHDLLFGFFLYIIRVLAQEFSYK